MDQALLAVTRVGEDDWRAWREIRLAALADAPDAFADTFEEARALAGPDWRAMTRNGAIFIATAGRAGAERAAVGVVAGIPRASALERGLGAMWVVPRWRGRGAAPVLAAAVIAWARSEGATRLGLWVPADNVRARTFYERQGFAANGRARAFPGRPGRSICEMYLELSSRGDAPSAPHRP